jgi:hypothetical protein
VIHVEDDLARGRLQVRTGDLVEVLHYDPDTGALTSPSVLPPEEASGVIPTYHLDDGFEGGVSRQANAGP